LCFSRTTLAMANGATDTPNGSTGAVPVGSAKRKSSQNEENAKYTRQGNPELGRLTGHEKEFEELGDLDALYEGLATKTRQHVNPLARHLQVPTPAPQWGTVFADPTLPLQIDVGCGSGRFVLIRALRLAGRSAASDGSVDATEPKACTGSASLTTEQAVAPRSEPRANVIGMEIRQKLVERAQKWADRLHLTNCGFIFTNATISWKSVLGNYPGPIELVSMQFPDPHFKSRHHKRRHVQPQLVREMAETLDIGARVFLQGDVPEAVRWMRDMIECHSCGRFALAPECRGTIGLMRSEWVTPSENGAEEEEEKGDSDDTTQPMSASACEGTDPSQIPKEIEPVKQSVARLTWSADKAAGWLSENPLGVPTERELYVSQVEAPVYRVMLVRV